MTWLLTAQLLHHTPAVACRGLGSPATLVSVSFSTGASLSSFWITNVACTGTEPSLLSCQSTSDTKGTSCASGGVTLRCPSSALACGVQAPLCSV